MLRFALALLKGLHELPILRFRQGLDEEVRDQLPVSRVLDIAITGAKNGDAVMWTEDGRMGEMTAVRLDFQCAGHDAQQLPVRNFLMNFRDSENF